MRLPIAILSRLILIAVLTALALSAAGASATPASEGRISSHLERLVAAGTVSGAGLNAMTDARLLRFDDEGRVEVIVTASNPGAVISRIEADGGRFQIADPRTGDVQAFVPVGAIPGLLAEPSVRRVSEPVYGVVGRGSVTTEADGVLETDLLRTAFGADGRGVRVGVISDGVRGIKEAQESSDLPAEVDIEACNVVPGADPQVTGAEGTAMLEIIHDLAPKAELWFGNYAFNTYLYFNEAVDCLAEHVDVIVDDISWFTIGPFDGTSPVSLNVTAEMESDENPLRMYVTSAGNFARRHWSGSFVACPDTDRQAFAEGSGTIDRDEIGGRCNNPVAVGPGATLMVFLQWDDPFGESCNNYDLLILTHDGADVLTSSTTEQDCEFDPKEVVGFTNTSDAMVTVDLAIERKDPEAKAVRFDMFVAGGTMNFYTPAGSIASAADADGAIAVGAINAGDPGLDDVQAYSSLGPAADGRIKPDITAVDCVSVTGAGGFGSPFCGTSAAAPHVAGIAAMLLGCNPELREGEEKDEPEEDREALRDALLETALERDPLGPDNTHGYGVINPIAAAEEACVPPEAVFGNVNCDVRVDTIDSLFLLRNVAAIPPAALCLDVADINCSGGADTIDALGLLRFAAALPPLPTPADCPPIGLVPGTR